MSLQQQIVDRAREWKDTPYKHQGRIRGRACDCAGVLLGVAWDVFGLEDNYDTRYGRNPDNWPLKSILDNHPYLEKRDNRKDFGKGDVVLMSLDGVTPHHIGIISNYSKQSLGLIHCYSSVGRVVEHRLNEVWINRIQYTYKVVEK